RVKRGLLRQEPPVAAADDDQRGDEHDDPPQTDLRECQGSGIPTEPEGRTDVEGETCHELWPFGPAAGSINASPELGSNRRNRCLGVSVIAMSSVGRMCPSNGWQPFAVPSALLTQNCPSLFDSRSLVLVSSVSG